MLDDEKLSHVADWLLGPPLKILAILVLASVANWVGRRAVKRSLTKLHSGAVRERMGAMRKRTPAALLETGETSVRAEQRIDALSSVLRSVLSFVIWATAALMCPGEVGIDLGPLIAGRRARRGNWLRLAVAGARPTAPSGTCPTARSGGSAT